MQRLHNYLKYSTILLQSIFNKSYDNITEENYRKRVFLENVYDILEHNQKYEQHEVSYKLSVNQFSDTTATEFETEFPFPDMSL